MLRCRADALGGALGSCREGGNLPAPKRGKLDQLALSTRTGAPAKYCRTSSTASVKNAR
ncbi:hypothetical protein SAMN04487905_105178 [Actinopolyspora xinjiangensis]|uniref:Uncharacterized protein n=1 Tax=Actinopolyspora xinjiangensis TaxID=405564 RepID=A0A1H0TPC0_9ACTN|nr:hypothetical protein SAMN04487905_105178 [Actinopolyspora xinjiangensis]